MRQRSVRAEAVPGGAGGAASEPGGGVFGFGVDGVVRGDPRAGAWKGERRRRACNAYAARHFSLLASLHFASLVASLQPDKLSSACSTLSAHLTSSPTSRISPRRPLTVADIYIATTLLPRRGGAADPRLVMYGRLVGHPAGSLTNPLTMSRVVLAEPARLSATRSGFRSGSDLCCAPWLPSRVR